MGKCPIKFYAIQTSTFGEGTTEEAEVNLQLKKIPIAIVEPRTAAA
jgi:hypothetical protein